MMNEVGINLNVLLTYKCNYKCNHCISNCSPSRQTVMETDQAKTYIDNIVAVTKVGQVGYTGGEPFLYYEMLKELMLYTYTKYGITGGVVTNCFWGKHREEAERKLDELFAAGLRSLVVSCDSYHLKFGLVEAIKNVVHKALDLDLSLCINTVVTKEVTISKDDVPDILSLSEHDMAKDITIKEIGPLRLGRASTCIQPDAYIETEDENYFNGACPYVISTPTIVPDGSVYACCCFGDGEINPRERIAYSGNVTRETYEEIFYNMNHNLLFSLFAHKGPYSILKLIRERRPDIQIRGKYLSNCDICVELYHNSEVKAELLALLMELLGRNQDMQKAQIIASGQEAER